MRQRNGDWDSTDALIDLVCSALGALIMLLVVLAPKPATKALTSDAPPLERELRLELFMPGQIEDPLYPMKGIYPLAARDLEIELELGGERTALGPLAFDCRERKRSFARGDLTITACSGPSTENRFRSTDPLHVEILLLVDGTDDSAWPMRIKLEARVRSETCAVPKHLEEFWHQVQTVLRANPLDYPPNAQAAVPAFPRLKVSLEPGGLELSSGPPFIPTAHVYSAPGSDCLSGCPGLTGASCNAWYEIEAAASDPGATKRLFQSLPHLGYLNGGLPEYGPTERGNLGKLATTAQTMVSTWSPTLTWEGEVSIASEDSGDLLAVPTGTLEWKP